MMDADRLRMLVVDLDGTALRGRDVLVDEDLEAAARLRAAGIAVTIATGRLVGGTAWVARELGVQGGFAVMNGSARFDLSGRRHHHNALGPELLARLDEQVRSRELGGFLFRSHSVHLEHDHAHHRDYLAVWTDEVLASDEHDWTREDVLAVGVVGGEHQREQVRDLAAFLDDEHALEVVGFDTYGGEPFLSVRNAHDDKGTALEAMAAERGLQPDQVVAVGDWWNDVPMLRRAGYSFAMREAAGGATEAADAVLSARRGHGGAIAEIAQRVWGL